MFLTFCLEILENEVIVDVTHCCWVQLRPRILLEASGQLSHWNYRFVFIVNPDLIKLAELMILLECLKYSLLSQKII